jgi:protein-disulfide isomerase
MGKSSSKAAASSRKAKIQAAQQASSSGPNRIVVITVVAIIAIVAVVGGVIVAAQSNKADTAKGDAVPAGAAGMGQGFVANTGVTLVAGAPTVDIYEDFQCPVCGQLEAAIGSTVRSLADAGKVKLLYNFKTIIDGNFNTDFSLKASNGALCAADAGKFEAYHSEVYAAQPQQEGSGWTDAQLTTFAENAGITGAALDTWKTCFSSGTYDNYVRSTEEASSKKGINATPTVYINGAEVKLADIATPELFTAAITAATK